ncbi:hypothetical protein F2Q69_00013332 [Brassica cretica]|uniref:Uncharacterized protein n=1 Tax=Brassica cretica TaxID=69181 RepID=A0A8S9QFF6_BRACR|nr:hypothetical protein F2Q69_00013332 [Brassica cretica]
MNPIVDAPDCIDYVEMSLETFIEVLRKAPNVSPSRLIVPTSIDEIQGRNSSATPLKTGNFSEVIVTICLHRCVRSSSPSPSQRSNGSPHQLISNQVLYYRLSEPITISRDLSLSVLYNSPKIAKLQEQHEHIYTSWKLVCGYKGEVFLAENDIRQIEMR